MYEYVGPSYVAVVSVLVVFVVVVVVVVLIVVVVVVVVVVGGSDVVVLVVGRSCIVGRVPGCTIGLLLCSGFYFSIRLGPCVGVRVGILSCVA